VSEIFGQQRFNTALFCAIVARTKRELKAAIFKTGGRMIRSVSEDSTVFQWQNKLQVFFHACQNLEKQSTDTYCNVAY